MEENKLNCDICDSEIVGKPFSLSALDGTSRVLQICEACTGPEVTICHAGIEVVIDRDDFLRADEERFFYAVEAAACSLEDLGWKLDAIEVSRFSDQVNEPLDLE